MSRSGPPGAPLTAAELDVLALVADGCTTDEIADALGLSRDAVLFRITSLRRKLGARDRTHAVVLAYRSGQLLLGAPATSAYDRVRELADQILAVLGGPSHRRAA